MPRVRGNIPNLVNGVSQQAPSLRLPSQSELDINGYPLIVDGLVKRPPTVHSGKLTGTYADSTFFHTILRDVNEQYTVAIKTDGTITVHDLEGNAKTVSNLSSGYLSGLTDPRSQLKALTVADHTFIVNKTKTVAAASDTAPTRPYEGVVWVRSGQYGRTYKIKMNGNVVASFTTPDGGDASHSSYIDTSYIAGRLYDALVSAGVTPTPPPPDPEGDGTSGGGGVAAPTPPAYSGDTGGDGGVNSDNGWTTARYGSVIYIARTSADFDLSTDDGYAGTAMNSSKGLVEKISDLPKVNIDGFVIKVAGPEGQEADDYWVRFEPSAGEGSSGVYRETVKPGELTSLDASTMPHILVREGDGTFTFKAATWGTRETGDADRNPDPSFVGQTIADVFFHRSRLGFLTAENVVLSRTNNFYDFYRETIITILDTDPIDVAADHIKVSYLNHAVPFQDILVMFSDTTQFKLDGNETLTPKTVSARPLTELAVSPSVRPVPVQNVVYFVGEGEQYSQLYEFFVDKAIEEARSESVSPHAPQYIPAGVDRLVASPDQAVLFAYSPEAPNKLFIYKFYVANDEKLQSAWCEWEFPGVDLIGDIEVWRTKLIMTVRRGDDWFIEKLNFEPGQGEKIYLDRKTYSPTGSYNAGTDETTFTLDRDIEEGEKFVTVEVEGVHPLGVVMRPKSIAGNVVKFSGDKSAWAFQCGLEFTQRHRFSQFFYRDPGSNERIAITDGRLQVYYLVVNYAASSYFRVEVTPEGRETRTYSHTGYVVSDPDTELGKLLQVSGQISIPILSRSDRVVIDLVNDTWRPSAFTSATWLGNFNPTSRER